ncbi:MAG: hypothetical protein V4692_12035, partial [Bdellovibrionota bacterium]
MKSLFIALIGMVVATSASADSQVQIVKKEGQKYENGVLVVKPGESITVKFRDGFSGKEKSIFVSGSTYYGRVPIKKIAQNDYIPKYLHCAMMSGANDSADPSIYLDDPAELNSAKSEYRRTKTDIGGHTWLELNEKNEVSFKISSNQSFRGSKNVYLKFSDMDFSKAVNFYFRANNPGMWIENHEFTRKNVTTADTGKEAYQKCIRP